MSGLGTALVDLAGAAGRLGGMAAETLRDRLELLALELREGRVRFLQLLILGILGTALLGCGLLLAAAAVVFALPPEWRVAGLAALAAASLGSGGALLCSLKRRLRAAPGLFDQSLAELKKDSECF